MTPASGGSSASAAAGKHLSLYSKLDRDGVPLGFAIALIMIWEFGVRFGEYSRLSFAAADRHHCEHGERLEG